MENLEKVYGFVKNFSYNRNMKVLVVDHDPRVQRLLKRVLKDDFVVDTARNAEEAERLAYSAHYDVILLDLVLPDMDGEDLCGLLKTRLKHTPVIVVSSRSSVSDKELAFERGADDFLVKPISSRELKARMRAILRRERSEPVPVAVLRLRQLKLDLLKRVLTYKRRRIPMRKKEMQLLEFLLSNKGRVLTRGEILENVWDMNVNPFTNTVEVHVKRLRDKIEKPYGEKYIETIHGVGYLVE